MSREILRDFTDEPDPFLTHEATGAFMAAAQDSLIQTGSARIPNEVLEQIQNDLVMSGGRLLSDGELKAMEYLARKKTEEYFGVASEPYTPADEDMLFFAYDDFFHEGLRSYDSGQPIGARPDVTERIGERYGLDEHSLLAAKTIGENNARVERGVMVREDKTWELDV
jgi:hypothetical protein